MGSQIVSWVCLVIAMCMNGTKRKALKRKKREGKRKRKRRRWRRKGV